MNENPKTKTNTALQNLDKESPHGESEKPPRLAVPEKIRREKIRTLNDLLRTSFATGRVVYTQGIAAFTDETRQEILRRVQTFSLFTQDNDPHEQHDFGSFDFEGNRIMWKIDYYDKDVRYGSEDPADPEVTTRVLTVLLSTEY